jgi:hypothetical protein
LAFASRLHHAQAMRSLVLALLVVTTACHTTMRTRTTWEGVVTEQGACVAEDVGPHEACEEHAQFDESRTVLIVAAVVAAVLAGAVGVGYARE